ncbi:MAG TPA: repressor LexA [Deltaproteobacteria bacterium]|nr:repressor LexA [Deltaproteobacteria bacterium]
MANKPSPVREKILGFIGDFRAAKGYSPTVREIAEGCGVSSPSVVHYHLNALERVGLLSREKDKFRSISLAHESGGGPWESIDVPLLGVIAAGHPISVDSQAVQEATEHVAVPADMVRGNTSAYALRVKGNSMVDAMIGDGDIVIMEQPLGLSNGDVVAVWLKNEQEVTLKKIYVEGDRIRLQPCNPYMMPIYHNASNVEVQGRVVGVLRTVKNGG